MATSSHFTDYGTPGEHRLTVRISGAQDIFRFAINMLNMQVEFFEHGRGALVELREALGADRFDPMAKSLLGEQYYGQMKSYFERSTICAACDSELADGEPRRPLPLGRVVGKSCDEEF